MLLFRRSFHVQPITNIQADPQATLTYPYTESLPSASMHLQISPYRRQASLSADALFPCEENNSDSLYLFRRFSWTLSLRVLSNFRLLCQDWRCWGLMKNGAGAMMFFTARLAEQSLIYSEPRGYRISILIFFKSNIFLLKEVGSLKIL